MTNPVINIDAVGSELGYTQVWEDTFDDNGAGPGPNFAYDLMDDALNRAGNKRQDENGNASEYSVPGKRWAGWTNGDNDSFVSRKDGFLHVGGNWKQETDPTRENYSLNGNDYPWRDNRLYAPYMIGQSRKWSDDANGGAGGHIVDDNKPNTTFGPNHFFEIRVSFEEMKTQGFRFSVWLMPAWPNESLAYEEDEDNGVEIDIFEYENSIIQNSWDRIQQKVLGGVAGNSPDQGGGNVKLSDYELDLRTGFHTIGLLWTNTKLHWYIDGKLTMSDNADLVPQVQHNIQITRELNSGAMDTPNQPFHIPSLGIKRPEDVGLYPPSSAILDKDKIPTDKGRIDYIRVWKINSTVAQSLIDNNGEVTTDAGGSLINTGESTGYTETPKPDDG